jgi:hypothetical protein
MNHLLTAVCFLVLLVILALPLGLIALQLVTDGTRRRKPKAVLTDDVKRDVYALFV